MLSVLEIYKEVIDDVISAVREIFLENAVDEQVLQELKQSWETKLLASKAVDTKTDLEKQITKKHELANGNGLPKQQQQQQQHQSQQSTKQVVGQVAPNNHVQTPAVAPVETKMVPIQITLPSAPGTNLPARVLTIQVPAAALHNNQLQKVITGPIITTTMNLPPALASSVLQQHVNAAFNQLAPGMIGNVIGTGSPSKTVIQNDGAHDDEDAIDIKILAPSCSTSGSNNLSLRNNLRIFQSDGPEDTSDEDDDGSDDDEPSDNDDDDKDEDEQEMDEAGPEEEPLNSEDDVTDEDPTDLFDTENVVVCQYDKITRSRNKWKFHLKDGIMNLNGKDILFQKASGDAEW